MWSIRYLHLYNFHFSYSSMKGDVESGSQCRKNRCGRQRTDKYFGRQFKNTLVQAVSFSTCSRYMILQSLSYVLSNRANYHANYKWKHMTIFPWVSLSKSKTAHSSIQVWNERRWVPPEFSISTYWHCERNLGKYNRKAFVKNSALLAEPGCHDLSIRLQFNTCSFIVVDIDSF